MTKSKSRAVDDTTRAAIAAGVLGVLLTVFALGIYGSRTAFSVAVGASIAVLNLVTMRMIVRSLLRGPDDEAAESDASEKDEKAAAEDGRDHRAEGRRGGAAWGVFAVFKVFILFGGIMLLLTRQLVDPIPLVVGYGVLPLGITVSTLLGSLAPRR